MTGAGQLLMELFIPREVEFILQPHSSLGKKSRETSTISLIGTEFLNGMFESGGEFRILFTQVLTLSSSLFEQLCSDFSELLIRLLIQLLQSLGRRCASGLKVLAQGFDRNPTLRGFRADMCISLFRELLHFLGRRFTSGLKVSAQGFDRSPTLRGFRAQLLAGLFRELLHFLGRCFTGGLKVLVQYFDGSLPFRGFRADPLVERINFLLGIRFEGIKSSLEVLAQFGHDLGEALFHTGNSPYAAPPSAGERVCKVAKAERSALT